MMSAPPARKKSRQTKACTRCRSRKIRCDFQYPTCGSCSKAGAPCLGFDTLHGVDKPRSVVAHLEAELVRLQADFNQQQTQTSDLEGVADVAINTKIARLANATVAPWGSSLKHTNDLRLTAPCFLTSSPVPHIVSQAQDAAGGTPSREPSPRASSIPAIPRNVIDVMIKHYCGTYRPQYPALEEADLYEAVDKVCNNLQPSDFDVFCVAITLAISTNTLMHQDEKKAMTATSEFWATAEGHLHRVGAEDSWERLQAMQLLTHYAFLNPQLVDCSTCAAISSRLCFQLGLHQELPAEMQAKMDSRTLDTRRRMFWNSYSIDSAVQVLRCRPFTWPMSSFTAKVPSSIPKTSQTEHMWVLRGIELEIVLALYHPSVKTEYSSKHANFSEWLTDLNRRLYDWHQTVRQSVSLSEKIEFHQLFYLFQMLRLNRPSPRLPRPSTEMQKKALESAVALIREFTVVERLGKFFYLWHAAHVLVESSVCLLASILVGIHPDDDQSSHLEGLDPEIIKKYVVALPSLLWTVSRRWTEISQHAAALEEVSAKVLYHFEKWIATGRSELEDPGTIKQRLGRMSWFSPFPCSPEEVSFGSDQTLNNAEAETAQESSISGGYMFGRSTAEHNTDPNESMATIGTTNTLQQPGRNSQAAAINGPVEQQSQTARSASANTCMAFRDGLCDNGADMLTWDFAGMDPDDIFAALLCDGQDPIAQDFLNPQ